MNFVVFRVLTNRKFRWGSVDYVGPQNVFVKKEDIGKFETHCKFFKLKYIKANEDPISNEVVFKKNNNKQIEIKDKYKIVDSVIIEEKTILDENDLESEENDLESEENDLESEENDLESEENDLESEEGSTPIEVKHSKRGRKKKR